MDLDALLGLLFFVVFVVVPMISGARKRGKGKAGPQPAPGQGAQRTGGQGTAGRGAPQQQGTGGRSAGGTTVSSSTAAGTSSAPRPADHPASATLEEIRRRVQEAQERERSRDAGRRPGQATAQPQRPAARGLVSSDPFEGRLVSAPGKTLTGGQYSPYDGSSTLSRPQGMGREGMSGEWPPPTNAPLAGGGYSSQLGREGTATGTIGGTSGPIGREGLAPKARSGRTSPLGREGMASGPLPGKASPLGREGGRLRGKRRTGGEIGGSGAQPAPLAGGARLVRAGLVSTDRHGILQGLIWHQILGEPPSKKRLRRTRSRPQ